MNHEVLKQQTDLKYLPEFRKSWWNQPSYRVNLKGKESRQYMLKRLHDAGANLLLGTDFSNPYVVPGFSIREELQRYVDSGFSPYETIKIATYNAAKFMKNQDKFGTIEKGKDADLILLNANPLRDVANIKKPLGVMAKGRWYPKPALEKMLSEIEKQITQNGF